MGKIKHLLVPLLGILTIVSCSNLRDFVSSSDLNHNSNDSSSNSDPYADHKVYICFIQFNGEFVKNSDPNPFNLPIAFDSYRIENNYLTIDGRAYCSSYSKYDADLLEHDFNNSKETNLFSYDSSFNASNNPSFRWEIKELLGDLIYSFSIYIDISSFIEHNATLGLLCIGYDFDVQHDFKGAPVC